MQIKKSYIFFFHFMNVRRKSKKYVITASICLIGRFSNFRIWQLKKKKTKPPHLLRNTHEPMRKYAELNGVQFGGDLRSGTLTDRDLDVAARGHGCCAIGLYEEGTEAVHNYSRTFDFMSVSQRLHTVDSGILVPAFKIHLGHLQFPKKQM